MLKLINAIISSFKAFFGKRIDGTKLLKEHYERLSDERLEKQRNTWQDEILEFQNKLRVSNQQNIELQNKIKAQNETLSSKSFLRDEEKKENKNKNSK